MVNVYNQMVMMSVPDGIYSGHQLKALRKQKGFSFENLTLVGRKNHRKEVKCINKNVVHTYFFGFRS